MSDPDHPIWSFLRAITATVCLTIVLLLTASHFDSTETWTICAMFVLLSGNEYASYLISHWKKQKDE